MSEPELRELRIVDFSTHLSGPLASRLLMDVDPSVRVVKVEHPVLGDGNRAVPPRVFDQGFMHASLNPGARSVAVHPRSPHWPRVVASLTGWADAVLVGTRPAGARARGIDFASLVVHNPRLVYCMLTGYGLAGPWAGMAAHGQNPDAMAGQVPVTHEDGRPVTPAGWRSSGSSLAGVFGALGVLAALSRRDRGAGAQFVHTSLWASALWWSWRDLNALANLGERWMEYRDRGSRYAMYTTRDQRVLIVCPIERKFWQAFVDVADLPREWRDRGTWEGGMEFGQPDEAPVIADRVARRTLDDWVEILGRTTIPFAPVLGLEDVLASEHARANAVMQETSAAGHDLRIAAAPVRVAASEAAAIGPRPAHPAPPPEVGRDTREILEELGLDDLVGADLSA